jgi:uncharacterized protein (TIGR03067 family)
MPPAPQPETAPECAAFEYVESATLTKLQGEWSAVKIVRDGQEVPATMLTTGHRSATKNEVKITFGGQMIIHALVRIDENTEPIHVDYYSVCGSIKGMSQLGIMKWIGKDACFNTALPGQPRPEDFTAPAGSGRVLSQWRKKS